MNDEKLAEYYAYAVITKQFSQTFETFKYQFLREYDKALAEIQSSK